ncbi:MAG: tyrosine-type recombinase/integrase, partial [Pseudonocardiaceae bacterium]
MTEKLTQMSASSTKVDRRSEHSYKPSAVHAADELMARFPPRVVPVRWPLTAAPRAVVIQRLVSPSLRRKDSHAQQLQERGVRAVLDWLEEFPGDTWQDRLLASTSVAEGDNVGWKQAAARWWSTTGGTDVPDRRGELLISTGLMTLICGDVVRPDAGWLMSPRTPKNLTVHLARTRDPHGWARLQARCDADPASRATKATALCRIAVLLAARGGTLAEITVGDCLELLQTVHRLGGGKTTSGYFYQLLHATGIFDTAAPATVRAFGTTGQLRIEDMVDRYRFACRPVRDLVVHYLRERQSTVDYVTLQRLATTLGKLFWTDLEQHHPGIDSLRLAPEVATGWKQRVLTRESGLSTLATVRAFYLDIAQWAMEDPPRWGPWAAPCPIRADEMSRTKTHHHRKSRMDHRTRERLPVLPNLVAAVNTKRRAAAELLQAARATPSGETFTAAGHTLRRTHLARPEHAAKTWAEDPDTGARRDLTHAEHQAFWAWAVVEVLRHTGLRVEELCELSHHSFVQYTLPSTGELIPLLHVAPSKTDTERLLVISPELADVLSAIVCRIRDHTGAVPLVAAYDYHEKVWNPLMPLLFQRHYGGERRPITPPAIRRLLNWALAKTGFTDTAGNPLTFLPHDFRRIFITDAVMNGMPPHIAQLVVGHRDINTTMGYKAVYPEEVINGHRAYIARRRTLRPSEEY